jgi:hypothetical protein
MSSVDSTPAPTQNEINKPVVGARLTSKSGRQYSIECVLQEKDHRPERVYLASYVIEYSIGSLFQSFSRLISSFKYSRDDGHKFVLKEIPPSMFELACNMQRDLITHERSHYLRLMRDAIPERSILIYDYTTDHLLSIAQQNIPLAVRKRILRDALRGLAVLHDKNIVHAATSSPMTLAYSNGTDPL